MASKVENRIDDVEELVFAIQGTGYENLEGSWGKWLVGGSPGTGFPWRQLAFGFKINPTGNAPTVVRIFPGEVHHGARTPVSSSATDKTITEDGQYVWVEYTFGESVTIGGPSTTLPVTTEGDSKYKVWLYQFALVTKDDESFVRLNKIGHMGNIYIPSAFG
jgi:hypothetical protein